LARDDAQIEQTRTVQAQLDRDTAQLAQQITPIRQAVAAQAAAVQPNLRSAASLPPVRPFHAPDATHEVPVVLPPNFAQQHPVVLANLLHGVIGDAAHLRIVQAAAANLDAGRAALREELVQLNARVAQSGDAVALGYLRQAAQAPAQAIASYYAAGYRTLRLGSGAAHGGGPLQLVRSQLTPELPSVAPAASAAPTVSHVTPTETQPTIAINAPAAPVPVAPAPHPAPHRRRPSEARAGRPPRPRTEPPQAPPLSAVSDIAPIEPPTLAMPEPASAMYQTEWAGAFVPPSRIPLDQRRHPQNRYTRTSGFTLLRALPGLAAILDPQITAAQRDLILAPGSNINPQYYSAGISSLAVGALRAAYNARWSATSPAQRNRMITQVEHYLREATRVLPQLFRNAAAIEDKITHVIREPLAALRASAVFDRLVTPRGASRTISERLDVAASAVQVTSSAVRHVRYINPAVMRYVPHVTSGGADPRRVIFNPLADVLRERMSIADTDAEALAAIDQRLHEVEETTRAQVIAYATEHPNADLPDREQLSTLPITTDIATQSHDVLVGSHRVHLDPVAPGALIERPGGYRASMFNAETGGSETGAASDAILNDIVGGNEAEHTVGFPEAQQHMARAYLAVLRQQEGSMTSLNTWDRLRITLGSGIGASGRLQDRLAELQRTDPEAFERLFGRHGVGAHRRGFDAHGIGHGRSTLSNDKLEGVEATEAIANNPRILGTMVAAGSDPAWQRNLVEAGAASLRRGLQVTLSHLENRHISVSASGGDGGTVYDWLVGHVSDNLLAAAMFSFADDFHGAGHISAGTVHGIDAEYVAAGGDREQLAIAPASVRQAIAVWLAQTRSHPNRRRAIATALGVASYDSITN